MTRVLKILLVGIFLFLIVVWVSTVFETCSTKKDADTDNTEAVKTSNDDVDVGEDIFNDEDTLASNNQQEAGQSGGGQNDKTAEDDNQDLVDYTGEAPVTTAKSTSKAKAGNSISKKKSTAGGRYMVVAGSFLDKANAVRMQRRLRKLGYNAEIVNFNLSQYYTVIAGRYQSRSTAQAVVRELKRDNIDAYVHKRKN